jgi:hypothetical protein
MMAMSQFKSHPQHADPLADARAWLAHMERTLARLAAEYALEKQNDNGSTIEKQPGHLCRSGTVDAAAKKVTELA